jgi:hypothetical protein
METYFAPPERAGNKELQEHIDIASNNPVIDGVMKTVSGLLAVLNTQRQIVSINKTLLDMLGLEDASEVFGLRPGEAIDCVHATEMPGGCGTSSYCSTCGAAIAIVTCLANDRPVEKKCAATIKRNGKLEEMCFSVRCCTISLDGRRFLLLFLRDITETETRAALERVFFHDVNNIITVLGGTSELMGEMDERGLREEVGYLQKQIYRLKREIMIQSTVSQYEQYRNPMLEEVSLEHVIKEIRAVFAKHPAAHGKMLSLPEAIPRWSFYTDPVLLLRILTNMLINAFEATEEGGEVKFRFEQEGKEVSFCVWNRQAIDESVGKRIFQRHFSTKHEPGRGLGTYAVKLFGEKFLGGRVGFTSTKLDGTEFCITLPA